MRHAAAHGYPVPRVYGTEPGAMVLERLYGPTMLGSLLAGSVATSALTIVATRSADGFVGGLGGEDSAGAGVRLRAAGFADA